MLERQQATKVGCCGFSTRQSEYYRLFHVVELQSTFYKLPRISTAERWRGEAPSEFEFCLKAWQVITHPSTSPTWRRIGKLNQLGNKTKYGDLRPTRENFDAWEKTLQVCKALQASVCVIQCPPSFKLTRRNSDNTRRFLGQIERGNVSIAWEPRGTWKERPDQIKKLCRQLDLIHATDILKSEPATRTETCYFRLHGLGARDFNYKYNYSARDLARLKRLTLTTLQRGAEEVFVMFNNISMLENAKIFDEMIHASQDLQKP